MPAALSFTDGISAVHSNHSRYLQHNAHPNHDAKAPSWPETSQYLDLTITLKIHHSWQDSSGRVISPTQRPLTTHNTHTRQTAHAPGGIRPRNPSKPAGTQDTRIKLRGHGNRRKEKVWRCKMYVHKTSPKCLG